MEPNVIIIIKLIVWWLGLVLVKIEMEWNMEWNSIIHGILIEIIRTIKIIRRKK